MNSPYIFVEHNSIKQGSTVSIWFLYLTLKIDMQTSEIIKEHSVWIKITIHKQQYAKHSRVNCDDTAGVKWKKRNIKRIVCLVNPTLNRWAISCQRPHFTLFFNWPTDVPSLKLIFLFAPYNPKEEFSLRFGLFYCHLICVFCTEHWLKML